MARYLSMFMPVLENYCDEETIGRYQRLLNRVEEFDAITDEEEKAAEMARVIRESIKIGKDVWTSGRSKTTANSKAPVRVTLPDAPTLAKFNELRENVAELEEDILELQEIVARQTEEITQLHKLILSQGRVAKESTVPTDPCTRDFVLPFLRSVFSETEENSKLVDNMTRLSNLIGKIMINKEKEEEEEYSSSPVTIEDCD